MTNTVLKDMLQDLINDRMDSAESNLHTYLQGGMRKAMGLEDLDEARKHKKKDPAMDMDDEDDTSPKGQGAGKGRKVFKDDPTVGKNAGKKTDMDDAPVKKSRK